MKSNHFTSCISLTAIILVQTFQNSFAQHREIALGVIDTIASTVLNEKRQILVHTPATPQDDFTEFPNYPVLFVLDGEVLFHQVVAITETLSAGQGNYAFPKMIVVGITNTDRMRDLTPTHSDDGTVMPAFLLSSSGGGKEFLKFINTELIPYIETKYPAAPHRTLIGHSLGGLLAMESLSSENTFNSFIAIDPSMWWDNLNYLRQVRVHIATMRFQRDKSLYIAIANANNVKSLQEGASSSSSETLPMRAILQLDSSARLNSSLKYKSKFYQDYGSWCRSIGCHL